MCRSLRHRMFRYYGVYCCKLYSPSEGFSVSLQTKSNVVVGKAEILSHTSFINWGLNPGSATVTNALSLIFFNYKMWAVLLPSDDGHAKSKSETRYAKYPVHGICFIQIDLSGNSLVLNANPFLRHEEMPRQKPKLHLQQNPCYFSTLATDSIKVKWLLSFSAWMASFFLLHLEEKCGGTHPKS